jgi:hypothetical protein
MKTSTASQGDGGAPGTAGVTRLSAGPCRHDLWLTAAEAIGALEFAPVAPPLLAGLDPPRLNAQECGVRPSAFVRPTPHFGKTRPTILSPLMPA